MARQYFVQVNQVKFAGRFLNAGLTPLARPSVTRTHGGNLNSSERIVDYLETKTAKAGPAGVYNPLTFGGGPVLPELEFVSLYWGAFAQSDIDAMQAYLAGLAGYFSGVGAPVGQEQVLRQYGTDGALVVGNGGPPRTKLAKRDIT
jgi:hypothetical protein